MAENESPRDQTATSPDPDLQAHIEALGLTTLDDYVAWCARNGFSTRLKKHWKERLKERSFVTHSTADARLAQKKLEIRQPAKIIEKIFADDLHEDDLAQPHLKTICRTYEAAKTRPEVHQAFLRLLRYVDNQADLSAIQPIIPQYARNDDNTIIGGLLPLARHAREWTRPVEGWKPESRNARRQFASLARHLFAQWPVPAFFDAVWFKGASAGATGQQLWFIWTGVGGSLRCLDFPVPYTKRMAHHFMHAPAEYTVEQALRWGQIIGMDGDTRLVRAVLGTRLGTAFENEDFWATVLQFFVSHAIMDRRQIGSIIDFLHNEKFVPQVAVVTPGVMEQRGPAQPHLTLKGRTPASLLRDVESWHRDLATARFPLLEWPASGLESFLFVEETGGSPKIWTITELCSTKALVEQGREMRNCVASYARSAAHGVCSIWSMESESPEGKSKVLTIEVQTATRTIAQAKAKANADPGEKHRKLLRQWAEQEGLRVAMHV